MPKIISKIPIKKDEKTISFHNFFEKVFVIKEGSKIEETPTDIE
jgi:hypothetical protein